MRDLMTMLPIYAFMLIPVWIPLATMTCGALYDAIRGTARTTARSASAATAATAATVSELSHSGQRVRAVETAA